MPKSLSLAAYPAEFFDIARRCYAHETVRVPIGDVKAAHNMRLDYYGFRRALKDSGVGYAEEVKRQVDCVHIRFEKLPDGTHVVVFHHPDDSPTAEALKRALAQLSPSHPTPTPSTSPMAPPPVDETEDVLKKYNF